MLRDYQSDIVKKVLQINDSTLAVMPTGAGKTVCMAEIFYRTGEGLALAHRQELVAQISTALARAHAPHRIVAPDALVQYAIERHIKATGTSWVSASAPLRVASVDTLLRRADASSWLRNVHTLQIDEGHHVAGDNKWARLRSIMPEARLIGWTATPIRADRKPLSQHYREYICGPMPSDLVDRGFLKPLLCYGSPLHFDRSQLKVSSATGDYNQSQLVDAVGRLPIVGDIVEQYLRLGAGRRGVTFVVNVEAAEEVTEAYRAAGVRAEILHSGTNDRERQRVLDSEPDQIVNVDILGEGYDAPGLSVVSLGRPTESLGLHMQQIGRIRRPSPGQTYGIVIDHVGNCARHGLPDGIIDWQMDEAPQRAHLQGVQTPVRQCLNPECWRIYEGWKTACPYCGHIPGIEQATSPEIVNGDLTLFDPKLVEELLKRADDVASSARGPRPRTPREIAIWNNVNDRATAQTELRDALAKWGWMACNGYGLDVRSAYRLFYEKFGIDTMTACTLGGPAARQLTEKIHNEL
jgi:DNA repair protein RadD